MVNLQEGLEHARRRPGGWNELGETTLLSSPTVKVEVPFCCSRVDAMYSITRDAGTLQAHENGRLSETSELGFYLNLGDLVGFHPLEVCFGEVKPLHCVFSGQPMQMQKPSGFLLFASERRFIPQA
jgi:hypothetical protein